DDDSNDLVEASLRTLAQMAESAPRPEILPPVSATANVVESPEAGIDILNQVFRSYLGPEFLTNNLLMATPDPPEKLVVNGQIGRGEDGESLSPSGDWKKQRPKRGQYRKYDKEALDEAVQSVRRGEMSVHRAGSYYGVPHSTLEYKVKERNLAKQKPRDGSQNPSEECDSSPSPNEDEQVNNNASDLLFAQQFTTVM
ncbi:hypothetical protein PFISCL1PPCAC_26894, partial [Pristionchus fissidentatus]